MGEKELWVEEEATGKEDIWGIEGKKLKIHRKRRFQIQLLHEIWPFLKKYIIQKMINYIEVEEQNAFMLMI